MTALSARLRIAANVCDQIGEDLGEHTNAELDAAPVLHALATHLAAEATRAESIELAHLGVSIDHAMGDDLVRLVDAIEEASS